MPKKLNINVTGGSVHIGNVIQSEHGDVTINDMKSFARALESMADNIVQEMRRRGGADEDVKVLSRTLEELKGNAKSGDNAGVLGSLEKINKVSDWAVPMAKNVLSLFGFHF